MQVAARVTVGVPSFNQGRYLNQALASIFRQEVPLDVFVADGGSTDGSVDVIQRWERVGGLDEALQMAWPWSGHWIR
jgi:glycosyltransferase involved in cell wall biosynthesis